MVGEVFKCHQIRCILPLDAPVKALSQSLGNLCLRAFVYLCPLYHPLRLKPFVQNCRSDKSCCPCIFSPTLFQLHRALILSLSIPEMARIAAEAKLPVIKHPQWQRTREKERRVCLCVCGGCCVGVRRWGLLGSGGTRQSNLLMKIQGPLFTLLMRNMNSILTATNHQSTSLYILQFCCMIDSLSAS